MKLKSAIVASLCLSSLTLPAFAVLFGGTITQTVTSSNDPLYDVGDSFVGFYRYESATIDGDFFTDLPFYAVPGANTSLTGEFYFAFSPRPGENPPIGFQSLLDTPNGGELVVSGGQVIDFFWSFEFGGYYTVAYLLSSRFDASSYYDRPIYDENSGEFLPTPFVSGTLMLSAPTPVPDALTTSWMLVACVGGLAWVADKRLKPCGDLPTGGSRPTVKD